MKKMMFLVVAILFFSSCAAQINPNYQTNQNQQNENPIVLLQENKNESLTENANTVDDGNLNSNAYPCPQYAPPPPNWCPDGVIVSQGLDEHGCPLPPKCKQRSENKNNNHVVSRIRKEGEMCGGIAGFQCEEGLVCELDGTYPDASGTCKKADNLIPPITPQELEQGWYWGMKDQKKPGTPDDWIWVEAGRSSKWIKPPLVQNFEECVRYYPVGESYPRQCKTPDGRTYVENTNMNNTNGGKVSKINELCGGFANWTCEEGLECIYGPKGSDVGTCAKPNPNKNGVCVQVITFAKDPRTGACWQFPTPCDVPVGWSNCSIQVVP